MNKNYQKYFSVRDQIVRYGTAAKWIFYSNERSTIFHKGSRDTNSSVMQYQVQE